MSTIKKQIGNHEWTIDTDSNTDTRWYMECEIYWKQKEIVFRKKHDSEKNSFSESSWNGRSTVLRCPQFMADCHCEMAVDAFLIGLISEAQDLYEEHWNGSNWTGGFSEDMSFSFGKLDSELWSNFHEFSINIISLCSDGDRTIREHLLDSDMIDFDHDNYKEKTRAYLESIEDGVDWAYEESAVDILREACLSVFRYEKENPSCTRQEAIENADY